MMRIRTLKPEFWSHPLIGRLPGDVQALAIGLLNMADDEGYLLADASNVRSALRPFDDESSNVRRALDELAHIGWVNLRKHASHGLIGCIPNFCAHQRIDRPKASKLKKYYDVAIDDESTTNRRRIDEQTAEEGKGTGNREGNREQGHARAKKPHCDVSALQAIWNEHRGTLPAWERTGVKREREALRALRETPLEEWGAIVRRIASSAFCCGGGSTGWIATPDFLLKPGTPISVLEGKYDDRQTIIKPRMNPNAPLPPNQNHVDKDLTHEF